MLRRNVSKLTSIGVVKMVMRTGGGVVKHPRRIHDHFPHQTLLGKQPESVVYGRLGNPRLITVYGGKNLFRGKVLRLVEQYLGDFQPLGRGGHPMGGKMGCQGSAGY